MICLRQERDKKTIKEVHVANYDIYIFTYIFIIKYGST